jgi:hypothetical protein
MAMRLLIALTRRPSVEICILSQTGHPRTRRSLQYNHINKPNAPYQEAKP